MRARERIFLIIIAIVMLLVVSIFHSTTLVNASSAGPDNIGFAPRIVTQSGSPAPFTQNVTISYASPSALPFGTCAALPCNPKVLALQYAILYDSAVIDVDQTVCAVSPVDANTYCGVTAGAYAQAFAVQELGGSACPTNAAALCPNPVIVSGTIKRIFISSIAAVTLTGGVISPGGIHSTIHWKVTTPGSGSTSISFSASDTFYQTATNSPIEPGSSLSYTPTDGNFGLNARQPPIAQFKFPSTGGEYGGVPNQNVTLDGSASYDPDNPTGPILNGIMNWTWSFGDGSQNITTTVPTISHNYTTPRSYTARLQVGDSDQHLKSSWAAAVVSIFAANLRPVAKFTWAIVNPSKHSPQTVFTNTSIFFDASPSSDLDGDKLRYTWDFGDGHVDVGLYVSPTNCGCNSTHNFRNPGNFTVKLTVDEPARSVDLSNSTSQIITVVSGMPLPIVQGGVGLLELGVIGAGIAGLAAAAVYVVRGRRRGPGLEEIPDEWR